MTFAVHNPAQLTPEDPVEKRAGELLYPRHIGRNTAAGHVLVALLKIAADGCVTIARRTEFAAACGIAESTMRTALKTLEAAGIIETSRPGIRAPILVRLGNGPWPAARPDPQGDLFPDQAYVAAPPVLRVAADVVESTPDVATEPGAGHVCETQEAPQHETELSARRKSAAHVRGACAPPLPTPPRSEKTHRAENAQALSAADFNALWPSLCRAEPDETARRSQIPIPIPSPPGEKTKDTPPPASPAESGSVDARAKGGIAAGSQLVDLAARIARQVRLDDNFRWMRYSFALLAIQGPLSEHDIFECIAGSHGNGKAFTGAIKTRLSTRDPPTLERFTLLATDGSTRLHRLAYLRRELRKYGIELRPEDTQPQRRPETWKPATQPT